MIAIFGSKGFIGSRYCQKYPADIFEVPRTWQHIPENANSVVYFISTTDNYNVHTDPFVDIDTNLVTLMRVLSTLKPGQRFFFISSWFVYGDTDCPAREDSPCNPRGFYSITKRTAEQLIESYCKTKGLSYQILRLCNVYGETDPKVSKKRNALQYMIYELAKGNDIQLYNNGTDKRDFMHVDDVCRAIYINTKWPRNNIVNIGSGIGYEFASLIHYAKAKLGSKAQIQSIEPPQFHRDVQVKDMYLNIERLTTSGFEQSIDIWEGIDRIIANI